MLPEKGKIPFDHPRLNESFGQAGGHSLLTYSFYEFSQKPYEYGITPDESGITALPVSSSFNFELPTVIF
jgi:hypothetical protein